MKKERSIRHLIFLILGILVIIFTEILFKYLNHLVGAIMLLYSGYDLVEKIFIKDVKNQKLKVIDDLLIIVLAFIVFFLDVDEHFVTVCVIWSVWSIIREEWEIAEEVLTFERILVIRVLNFIESIVVIVLSVILIFNPTAHHAMVHVYLLGIELVLDMVFPLIELIILKIKNKNKQLPEQKENNL